MNKGNAGIFIIIGIAAIAVMAFLFISGTFKPNQKPQPSPSPATLSEDPKYKEVKEKYNLSEEQLQILSTVNQEDNE